MKTNTICQDTPCERGVSERPRYYARQLITADDLTLEQEYFRNKMRAHNRLLHGWGVVCGAHVCPNPDTNGGYKPWEVIVEPGYVLGPYGDDIVIDRPRVFDLRTAGVSGTTGEPGMEMFDPWCSQVSVSRSVTGERYIAVRYKECQARPVRVQPTGCSCDDNPCEFSRVQDGYEFTVLDDCIDSKLADPTKATFQEYLQEIGLIDGPGLGRKCVECPTEPWVVLAKVTIDDNGEITDIDNCECRRIVISFGDYALGCHTVKPALTGVDPVTVKVGDQNIPVTLTGTDFKDGMKVNMGRKIKVRLPNNATDNGTKYIIDVSVDHDAQVGPRAIRLINPDCATATFPDKFTVAPDTTLVSGQAPSGGVEKKEATKRAASQRRRKA